MAVLCLRWLCDQRFADATLPATPRGYESVYQPLSGQFVSTHWLADEWNLRHGIYADAIGTHRHHVDFDRLNNRPTNIERMDAKRHIALHNAENYGDDFDSREHGDSIRAAFDRTVFRRFPDVVASFHGRPDSA